MYYTRCPLLDTVRDRTTLFAVYFIQLGENEASVEGNKPNTTIAPVSIGALHQGSRRESRYAGQDLRKSGRS